MDNAASEFNRIRKTHWERLGNAMIKALQSRGYSAVYVPTKKDALEKVLKLVPNGASVGIPGTVTIREIGAVERLQERGCRILHHWDPSLKGEERTQRLTDELNCDIYLTSSNAITYDGRLVNIDGVGNRVAGMAWTRGKIIYVISINKACPDLESAILRVRDRATSMNAIRLGKDVPCAHLGYHTGCRVPKTLCRALLIMENNTMGREAHIILVGEELGF